MNQINLEQALKEKARKNKYLKEVFNQRPFYDSFNPIQNKIPEKKQSPEKLIEINNYHQKVKNQNKQLQTKILETLYQIKESQKPKKDSQNITNIQISLVDKNQQSLKNFNDQQNKLNSQMYKDENQLNYSTNNNTIKDNHFNTTIFNQISNQQNKQELDFEQATQNFTLVKSVNLKDLDSNDQIEYINQHYFKQNLDEEFLDADFEDIDEFENDYQKNQIKSSILKMEVSKENDMHLLQQLLICQLGFQNTQSCLQIMKQGISQGFNDDQLKSNLAQILNQQQIEKCFPLLINFYKK